MSPSSIKSPAAFLTISELADDLGLPQHILRYWETRFPQLRPLQRAGNRRYYRPEDCELARQINQWLNVEGYTVKGVQKILRGAKSDALPSPAAEEPAHYSTNEDLRSSLIAVRNQLARALAVH
jgi:DNA-binding transcriptional MerR regulator